MTFWHKLQLRDVAAHDATASLPLGGMLYFFIGVDEPAYNIEHRVLYLTEDQTAAVRRQAPEETTLEEEFTGYRIEARATLEPPNYAYVDDAIVEDEEHDFESYEDLCHQLTGLGSDDIAMIFGYPSTQHGDCEHEVALIFANRIRVQLLHGGGYATDHRSLRRQRGASPAGNSGYTASARDRFGRRCRILLVGCRW